MWYWINTYDFKHPCSVLPVNGSTLCKNSFGANHSRNRELLTDVILCWLNHIFGAWSQQIVFSPFCLKRIEDDSSVVRHPFPHCIRPSHSSPLEEILNLLPVLWNFPACIFLDLTVPVDVIYSSCSVKPVLMFWLYGLAAAVTIHQRTYNHQELYWVLTQIANHQITRSQLSAWRRGQDSLLEFKWCIRLGKKGTLTLKMMTYSRGRPHWWHSCQPRRGAWSYNSYRLTKIGQ